jgi:hypothetical protein
LPGEDLTDENPIGGTGGYHRNLGNQCHHK